MARAALLPGHIALTNSYIEARASTPKGGAKIQAHLNSGTAFSSFKTKSCGSRVGQSLMNRTKKQESRRKTAHDRAACLRVDIVQSLGEEWPHLH